MVAELRRVDGGRAAMAEARGRTHGLLQIGGGRRGDGGGGCRGGWKGN